jgi:hypothetical protein
MSGAISTCIRAHINRLDCNELFTTQDLLTYGNRGAVDQCLYRLTQSGYIKRLSLGVFLKCDKWGQFRDVSVEEVLKKKASTVGGTVVVQETDDGIRYLTNLSSSSVVVNGERITLIKTSNRKMSLGESKAASLLRRFWYEGKDKASTIYTDPKKFGPLKSLRRSEKEELRLAAPLIPDWLNQVVNRERFGNWPHKEEDRIRRLQALHRD